jgi:hypothetical protein
LGCSVSAILENDDRVPARVRLLCEAHDGRGHGARNWDEQTSGEKTTTLSCRVEFGAHYAQPGNCRLTTAVMVTADGSQIGGEVVATEFYVGQPLGVATQEWPKMDDPEVRRLAKELAGRGEPCSGRYFAQQVGSAVILFAFGSHPSSGYDVWLQPGEITAFPPHYSLRHIAPGQDLPRQIMPFAVHATFESREPVPAVQVNDRAGAHEVVVERPGEK